MERITPTPPILRLYSLSHGKQESEGVGALLIRIVMSSLVSEGQEGWLLGGCSGGGQEGWWVGGYSGGGQEGW